MLLTKRNDSIAAMQLTNQGYTNMFNKVLLVFMLLVVTCSYSQRRQAIITRETEHVVEFDMINYSGVYSKTYLQPVLIEYEVTCDSTVVREGSPFYLDKLIKTSTAIDYYGTFYDRGHMAHVAAFSCSPTDIDATFDYLNITLQHRALNRGVWKTLEIYEVNLLKLYEVVHVRIDIIFGTSSIKSVNATIPIGFMKTITYADKIEVYYFNNIAPTNKLLTAYKLR